MASLVAAYAGGDYQSCADWCRNIASRLWLGAMIDYRYSEAVVIENLHEVASRATAGLVLTGAHYADYVPEPYDHGILFETSYHKAVLELVAAMEPRNESDMHGGAYPIDIGKTRQRGRLEEGSARRDVPAISLARPPA